MNGTDFDDSITSLMTQTLYPAEKARIAGSAKAN
jgi:hypothetical protein